MTSFPFSVRKRRYARRFLASVLRQMNPSSSSRRTATGNGYLVKVKNRAKVSRIIPSLRDRNISIGDCPAEMPLGFRRVLRRMRWYLLLKENSSPI